MQLTENYDSYIAASGDEPGAAIFMSVFFIKIGFVPIGAEQDVRHPVRRSAHLFTDHIQVNIRYLLHNIITKNCRAKWRILHLQNGENCRGYSDHQAMKNPLQT